MRKHITLFLFHIIIATSLQAKHDNKYIPKLLPLPQNVVWNLDKEFELQNGNIPKNLLRIEIVDKIAEATVNQNEAYELTVTPDSVLIKATTPTGVYRAKQTLSQLIQTSSKSSIPS
ncbi:MAG: glycoside hydrolase family 20 zincin-like fold domain-containing protein, partial [Dysgonamonadaceae bacterium]